MLKSTDKYGDSVLIAAAKGGGGHEMFTAVLGHLQSLLTKDEVNALLCGRPAIPVMANMRMYVTM